MTTPYEIWQIVETYLRDHENQCKAKKVGLHCSERCKLMAFFIYAAGITPDSSDWMIVDGLLRDLHQKFNHSLSPIQLN